MRGEDDLGPPHPLARAAIDRGAARRVEPPSRVAPSASIVSRRSAELAHLAAGAPPSGLVADRAAVERARTAFFLDPRAPAFAHSGLASAAGADRAHLEACVGGASPDSPIAVTAIERAAGCAFAGFAQRVLRVRKLEDVAEAADPRERGTLLHRALRAAFEATVSLRATASREVVLAAARKAASRALDLDTAASPLRHEAHVQAVADAVRVVARALDAGDPVAFALGEKHFGAGELPPWQALELAAPGEPSVFVEGQIDRVDVSTDCVRARVVDYKTGKIPDAKSRGRRAFQLPLYAEVVARAMGAAELEAIYLGIRPGAAVEEAPRKEHERASTVEDRRVKIEEARRVVLRMFRGEVAPRPDDARLCALCDARDVCRRPDVAPVDDEPEATP
jgi:RecB family exonuclease